MLCLCAKDPDDDTIDNLKDFMQIIRRKEFEEVLILLNDNATKKLSEYIQLLIDVKLDDVEYHKYFGEVQLILNSFLQFYTTVIDEIIRIADIYSNVVTKDELIMLIDHTISTQQSKQTEFDNIFLPVKTKWEKRVFEELKEEYEEYIKKLYDLRDFILIKLDKQSKVDDFAKEHFAMFVRNMGNIFDTAQLYVGSMLSHKVKNTRISLEEILLRMRNNLAKLRQERDDNVNNLVKQLYEKHKERHNISRSETSNPLAIAEVNRGIEHLKTKINSCQRDICIERLEKEVEYWITKLDDLNEITHNISQLKSQQAQVIEDEKNCMHLKCNEMPECQQDCLIKMRIAYSQRNDEIQERLVHEMRALVTFFAVRGTNHIFYIDNIGPYFVDEYNHQNYYFDYGLAIYHRNCDGEFIKFRDEAYLFDKHGRYIEKNGEKLYQLASCTSQYKLNEADYMDKLTKDCGHSEKINKKCRADITDPSHVAMILPDFEPLDIKETLAPDTVKYLWDSFGSVLPDALHLVATNRPKNPIHFLAHQLLRHKYKRTKKEHEKKKAEAEQYRANILKARLEKAEVASKSSKPKKRAKPADTDDEQLRAWLAATAEDLFLVALNNME